MEKVMRGRVKWFNNEKGYGWIQAKGCDRDVFVHFSKISSSQGFRTLDEGEDVEFKLCEGPKGAHAENVIRLKEME
jgi:cold shock protein